MIGQIKWAEALVASVTLDSCRRGSQKYSQGSTNLMRSFSLTSLDCPVFKYLRLKEITFGSSLILLIIQMCVLPRYHEI